MNNLKWNIWDVIIIGGMFIGALLMLLLWGCIAHTEGTVRIGKGVTVTNYVTLTNWVTNYSH